MIVAGITQVRNEIEVIDFTIWFHLKQDLDFILVCDNGSTDGTNELLKNLNDSRIIFSENHGAFRQEDALTNLSRQAYALGADWVVPFDGDEMWFSKNKLKNDLQNISDGAILIPVTNFIQNRIPNKYLSVQYRFPDNYAYASQKEIEQGSKSSIEFSWGNKHIIRTSDSMIIDAGSHSYSNATSSKISQDIFKIYQVPIRSYEHLIRKAENGLRIKEAGYPYQYGWEAHLWAEKYLCEKLYEEWESNSEVNGIVTRYDGSHFTLEKDETVSVLYEKYLNERNL